MSKLPNCKFLSNFKLLIVNFVFYLNRWGGGGVRKMTVDLSIFKAFADNKQVLTNILNEQISNL